MKEKKPGRVVMESDSGGVPGAVERLLARAGRCPEEKTLQWTPEECEVRSARIWGRHAPGEGNGIRTGHELGKSLLVCGAESRPSRARH